MKKEIRISDLYYSTFRFYLKDKFRRNILNKAKIKYGNWEDVAKKLGIDQRSLFSIRRGWEFREGKKKEYTINSEWLLRIKKLLNLSNKELQNNIIKIRCGHGGIKENISLPIKLNKSHIKIDSIKGALLDYILIKNLERGLIKNPPKNIKKENNYFTLFPKIKKEYLDELRKRGLKPFFREDKNYFYISYRIPGTNKRKESNIPKKVIFDEDFAKQFGKWVGDRCGGLRKVGVANKNWRFVKEFYNFLKNKFNQLDINLYLTCKNNFKPNKKIIRGLPIVYSKTQYGDYAYRVEVANALLKNLVFDKFEKNLFSILYNSKKSIRFAFYAGLFEAEGSISKEKTLSFSFGLNLKKGKTKDDISNLYKKAIQLNYLLNKDGFNSRISRKLARTNKSNTLKYDVMLLNSKETRNDEVNFIKSTFLPYVTHENKLNTFKEVLIIGKTKN